jgi:hypothetical protein
MANTISGSFFRAFPASNAPGCIRALIADEGSTGTVTDLGATGLKHIRVRLMIKSGMSNGNTFLFNVRVGASLSGGAIVDPENVARIPARTFVTNDTYLTFDVFGWSYTGFRYFQIYGTDSGGTAVYDAIVDAW